VFSTLAQLEFLLKSTITPHQCPLHFKPKGTTMTNSEIIHTAMLEQPGVSAHPHRFGGTEYRLGTREIGHIHGESLVDIPFPKPVHDELISNGIVEKHHILPDSGWISFYLRQPKDALVAVDLLKRSLEIAREQLENREARAVKNAF
jgi:hypothetical protein